MISFTRFAEAALILAVSVLCLVALEFLVRIYIFDPNAHYIRLPGAAWQINRNGLLPASKMPSDHKLVVNRLGIRGDLPKFGANPKIAVLGGSTVEDWVLTKEHMWPKQLEKSLSDCEPDLWVANLGKSGVNARHHLLQLPEVTKYMPRFDMFVVLLGLNDFLYDYRIHHTFKTPPGWWKQQAFQYIPEQDRQFAIISVIEKLWAAYGGKQKNLQNVSDFGEYMHFLREMYDNVTDAQKVDDLPSPKAHLETYKNTIRALKAYADSYGAPIVFVTQPYVWSSSMSREAIGQVYAGFIGPDIRSPETKWYTSAAMETGLSAYNATLLEICTANSLSCVDAAKSMRNASFFYDDFHFSLAGARQMAEIVGRKIRSNFAGCR